MRRFFEECKLDETADLSKNRINKIKCSVLRQIEEDSLMKKRTFFRPLAIAIAATVVAGATAVGAVATAQTKIVEKDGIHYEVYQQDRFNTLMRQIDGYEVEEVPDESDFTLVSTNEYVDGDYRYVDTLFKYDNGARSSSIWWNGRHDVYYAPPSTDGIHLATMRIKGRYIYSEKQNIAFVDEDAIEVEAINHVDQTYPIITERKPTYESDQGGLFGGKRYAYIDYAVDFEKSRGDHDLHIMQLIVYSDGTAEVNTDCCQ